MDLVRRYLTTYRFPSDKILSWEISEERADSGFNMFGGDLRRNYLEPTAMKHTVRMEMRIDTETEYQALRQMINRNKKKVSNLKLSTVGSGIQMTIISGTVIGLFQTIENSVEIEIDVDDYFAVSGDTLPFGSPGYNRRDMDPRTYLERHILPRYSDRTSISDLGLSGRYGGI